MFEQIYKNGEITQMAKELYRVMPPTETSSVLANISTGISMMSATTAVMILVFIVISLRGHFVFALTSPKRL